MSLMGRIALSDDNLLEHGLLQEVRWCAGDKAAALSEGDHVHPHCACPGLLIQALDFSVASLGLGLHIMTAGLLYLLWPSSCIFWTQ